MGHICNCFLEHSIHLCHESNSRTHLHSIMEIGEMVIRLALDLGNTCHCRHLLFMAYRLRFLLFK